MTTQVLPQAHMLHKQYPTSDMNTVSASSPHPPPPTHIHSHTGRRLLSESLYLLFTGIGLPHSPKTDSGHLIKDNCPILLNKLLQTRSTPQRMLLVEILQQNNVRRTSVKLFHTISVLPMEYSQQSGNCHITFHTKN